MIIATCSTCEKSTKCGKCKVSCELGLCKDHDQDFCKGVKKKINYNKIKTYQYCRIETDLALTKHTTIYLINAYIVIFNSV